MNLTLKERIKKKIFTLAQPAAWLHQSLKLAPNRILPISIRDNESYLPFSSIKHGEMLHGANSILHKRQTLIINRPLEHSQFDSQIKCLILFIGVISLLVSKLVPVPCKSNREDKVKEFEYNLLKFSHNYLNLVKIVA